MRAKTAACLMAYGVFLIAMGLIGFLSNPEKAKTALISGGTFGGLSLIWGFLASRGVRWALPAATATTGLLIAAFTWRASAGWIAVRNGQSEKLFAAGLITTMLLVSLILFPVLLRELRTRRTASV